MNVSSQEKLFQNGNSLATGQTVSELNREVNSNAAYDENVLKNQENFGNHKSMEVLNGSPSCEPEDRNGTMSSPRKIVSEKGHEKEEIQPLLCPSLEQFKATPETETNKLGQPDKQKRGRTRKREIIITGSPRVLRSKSGEKPKVQETFNAPTQDAESSKERKKRKTEKIKKDPHNEFLKIKTHLRYLLSRMNYEQNFIDAYAGEGWKGQSLEKIRPEKELERAKSDITRYKLKIRDLFQRIERSCEEGRIPESSYDSEGLIDSEDIFCAKCGQKEVRLDNDIILCDGACDRGFHQFCLEPPLLKEQVPPGDEGWLCPACDCKIDCIDLLSDSQGTDLSISDGWEKVFPEAAASGNKLDDISGLPSDDSGDDDYDPDGPGLEEEVDVEDLSSDESDFSSASEDLGAVANNEQYTGLPSEDSEDDDFNPDGADSDEQCKTKSSSSDFTSDSEDLGEVCKNEGALGEVKGIVMSEEDEETPKTNMEDDDYGPITAKRHVERLDYKKLHDETYGNVSSDSSDDEFFDTEAPRRRKNTKGAKDMDFNQKQKQSESVPVTNNSSASKTSSILGSSDKSGTKSSYKRLGETATQKLYESFKENQYPDSNVRENLARELNLTHNQVRKWFENARWSFNHPGTRTKGGKSPPKPSTGMENQTPLTNQANEESLTPPTKARKRKTEADHNDAEVNPGLNKSARRSGRVQAKRL